MSTVDHHQVGIHPRVNTESAGWVRFASAPTLSPVIAQGWSLAPSYSLLAWYGFAPQCLSTLAVVKRETNSWRYPVIMAAYLFALAYAAAFVTYRLTLWWSGA